MNLKIIKEKWNELLNLKIMKRLYLKIKFKENFI